MIKYFICLLMHLAIAASEISPTDSADEPKFLSPAD